MTKLRRPLHHQSAISHRKLKLNIKINVVLDSAKISFLFKESTNPPEGFNHDSLLVWFSLIIIFCFQSNLDFDVRHQKSDVFVGLRLRDYSDFRSSVKTRNIFEIRKMFPKFLLTRHRDGGASRNDRPDAVQFSWKNASHADIRTKHIVPTWN